MLSIYYRSMRFGTRLQSLGQLWTSSRRHKANQHDDTVTKSVSRWTNPSGRDGLNLSTYTVWMWGLCCERRFSVLHHHFSLQCHTAEKAAGGIVRPLCICSPAAVCLFVLFFPFCVFRHQFLPVRDTWREPRHGEKTSPRRRGGGGGGGNDNTGKQRETRRGNKLRLKRKTIKVQRRAGEKTNTQTTTAVNKEGVRCVCEKSLERMNYSASSGSPAWGRVWLEVFLCQSDTTGCHRVRSLESWPRF